MDCYERRVSGHLLHHVAILRMKLGRNVRRSFVPRLMSLLLACLLPALSHRPRARIKLVEVQEHDWYLRRAHRIPKPLMRINHDKKQETAPDSPNHVLMSNNFCLWPQSISIVFSRLAQPSLSTNMVSSSDEAPSSSEISQITCLWYFCGL